MTRTTEPRPAASLSAALLTRRDGTQPIMRRQVLGSFVSVNPSLDDPAASDPGEARALTDPAPIARTTLMSGARGPSPVALQIDMIAQRMNGEGPSEREPATAPIAEQPEAATQTRKVAFTLRLDTERHIQLRRLSALGNISAQQFLVGVLDRLIAEQEQTGPNAAEPARPDK